MKIQKKHIIAGTIGLFTISGAFAYLQYQKLMDYVVKLKSVKIKTISAKNVDFDMFLNLQNKSALKYTLLKQKYDVFINNIFLVSLQNDLSNTVLPKSDNVIGLNVNFNPEEALTRLKMTAATLITGSGNIMVKIVTTIRAKWGIISFNIHYTYEDTLKNLMK